MMYRGIEVDMLSVGDADCLLASLWIGSSAIRVLIDGGNASDYDKIRGFLNQRNIGHLHAVLCTHMHADHAAGLLELARDESISIGSAYLHIPQNHVRLDLVERALKIAGGEEAERVRKTLKTAADLHAAFRARTLPVKVTEPFQGTQVEFLTVVGPSEKYYAELVGQFQDADAIRAMDEGRLSSQIENMVDDYLSKVGVIEAALLADPKTTAENNSSVISGTIFDGAKYLFTSDSGAPALKLAAVAYELANCHWMQIPHHGSRHNITADLITHFSPKTAYVSAAGNTDHPRRAVVNAFKEAGASVFSTHYPDAADLWNHSGTVPARPDYRGATPLYEKSQKAAA